MSSLLNLLILFVVISITHSFHVNIFHKSTTNTALKGTMIELEQYEGSFEKEVITCTNPVLGMSSLCRLFV